MLSSSAIIMARVWKEMILRALKLTLASNGAGCRTQNGGRGNGDCATRCFLLCFWSSPTFGMNAFSTRLPCRRSMITRPPRRMSTMFQEFVPYNHVLLVSLPITDRLKFKCAATRQNIFGILTHWILVGVILSSNLVGVSFVEALPPWSEVSPALLQPSFALARQPFPYSVCICRSAAHTGGGLGRSLGSSWTVRVVVSCAKAVGGVGGFIPKGWG